MAEFLVGVGIIAFIWAAFIAVYSLTLTQEECEEELAGYVAERLRERERE